MNVDSRRLRTAETRTELLRAAEIIESSANAIFSTSPDGVVQTWNPAAERLLDYPADEIIGEPITVVIPPRLSEWADEVTERVQRGEVIEDEARLRRRSGDLVWVSITMNPIVDQDGTLIALSGSLQDLTARKTAEQELIASERRFQLAFDSAPYGMARVDSKLRFVESNVVFEQITACGESELLGQKMTEIAHPDDVELLDQSIGRIFAGERETCRIDHRIARGSGGYVWVACSATVLREPDGTLIGGFILIEDISERRRVEAELRRSQLDLERRIAERTAAARRHEVRFQEILTNLPVIAFRIDPDGVFTESTGSGLRRLDLGDGEAIGMDAFALIPQARDAVARALAGEEVQTLVEGELGGSAWAFDAFFAPDSAFGGAIGFAIDATRRRETERQMHRSMQALADASGVRRSLLTIMDAIVGAAGDVSELFDRVAEAIAAHVGDSCLIALLSDDKRDFEVVAVRHREPNLESKLRDSIVLLPNEFDGRIQEYAVAWGDSYLIPQFDPRQMRDDIAAVSRSIVGHVKLGSVLVTPVEFDATVVAIMIVARDLTPEPFTSEERDLVENLAASIGIAIESRTGSSNKLDSSEPGDDH